MPEVRDPAFVVFDVCDTLYAANTTFDFLRFHAARTANADLTQRLSRWTSLRSARGLAAALLFRGFGIDLARTKAIEGLKGQSRDLLAQSAHDYVRTELPAKANAAVHERLRRHRDRGDRVMLVSSSLDIVIDEIAKALEVDSVASALEFAGGRCTGRLHSDLTGRKAALVQGLRDGETSLHVYTDNRSDIDLLRIADCGTVVLPAGGAQEPWAGANFEYVRL